ncbi:MAG: hypothetical protein HYX55_11440 [Chloroflexi bacterium]|nr:hypothetical protein [Chloroflexota bacterium]
MLALHALLAVRGALGALGALGRDGGRRSVRSTNMRVASPGRTGSYELCGRLSRRMAGAAFT